MGDMYMVDEMGLAVTFARDSISIFYFGAGFVLLPLFGFIITFGIVYIVYSMHVSIAVFLFVQQTYPYVREGC
jgi:hypothetical protein